MAQPRMSAQWSVSAGYNTKPYQAQTEQTKSGIVVVGSEQQLPPVQSGVPFSELQQPSYAPSTSFQPARYPSGCGMPFRSLCSTGYGTGNSGYNPGYGNGNSGYNPGYGNGNSGYNPGYGSSWGNGNSGYNPGYGNGNSWNGNGNSGYNPGFGGDENSGYNPGDESSNAGQEEEDNSGFNPGNQDGNSGFNPGYGNGNMFTPLPGRGSCYNVCGTRNMCGSYGNGNSGYNPGNGNGYGYSPCRPRPVCRPVCNVQPVCPGNQWNYANNGNSYSCGQGSG